jgi:hypothetical protein
MYNNLKLGKAIAIKTKAGVIVQINSISVFPYRTALSGYLEKPSRYSGRLQDSNSSFVPVRVPGDNPKSYKLGLTKRKKLR